VYDVCVRTQAHSERARQYCNQQQCSEVNNTLPLYTPAATACRSLVRSLAAEVRINLLHSCTRPPRHSTSQQQSAAAVAPGRCKLPFHTDSVDYVEFTAHN